MKTEHHNGGTTERLMKAYRRHMANSIEAMIESGEIRQTDSIGRLIALLKQPVCQTDSAKMADSQE